MKTYILLFVSLLLLGACRQSKHEVSTSTTTTAKQVDSLALALDIDQSLLVDGRHIIMEGAVNFRDLGGFKTKHGKTTQWKKIYRSGKLSGLSDKDRATMKALGIKTVVDFRTNAEIEKEPDNIDSSINYFHFPIGEDKWTKGNFFKTLSTMSPDSMDHFMTSLYQDIPLKWADSYKKFFEVLQNPSNTPLVFHCSAGKDRAGIATALVLSSLGVDMTTAQKDYLLSNYYRHEDNKKYVKMMAEQGLSPQIANKLLLLSPTHFNGIFGAISDKHGSLSNYKSKVLGVDTQVEQQLRKQFLN